MRQLSYEQMVLQRGSLSRARRCHYSRSTPPKINSRLDRKMCNQVTLPAIRVEFSWHRSIIYSVTCKINIYIAFKFELHSGSVPDIYLRCRRNKLNPIFRYVSLLNHTFKYKMSNYVDTNNNKLFENFHKSTKLKYLISSCKPSRY